MKKSLLFIPLLFLGTFTFASSEVTSFPSFPMTIHGNIKIGSSNLNGGTLRVYNSSNQELASYNINQDGKYGSDNVTIEPLLLNKFGGSLTFKVSYNGKSYVVDSIDDSNRGNGCPSKSSITFVSENCRYDITLKEEPSNNSGGSTSSGSGGKKSGSSSSEKSSNNVKSDTSKTKVETNKTETHKAADKDENVKTNTNKGQTMGDTKSPRRKLVNISQGNPSEVLGNGYTREQNNAYNFSYANGITSVKDIKDAKVNGPLTRIAMAKMLSYYAINVLGKTPDASKTIKFDDVSNKLNAQYNNAVVLSYQLGIMGQNMKNNKFRPNDEVSRAEFVTALSRMLYGTQDGKGSTKYYEPHMVKLHNEGIISKTDPKIKEKRGYVMTMLMRSAG